jgi:uncharacterized cupredoxin-like copper-binding protein
LQRIILNLLLAASIFGLSSCGHHHHANRIDNAGERVASADWSKQVTVTVIMSDFAYSPETLVFLEGVPTRLVIENQGSQKHYFTAEDFFRAIATRKVQSNTDGEIKAPYFTAIEVYPGRSLDLYFVPITRGAYPLHCTIPGHSELGMRGEIRIE